MKRRPPRLRPTRPEKLIASHERERARESEKSAPARLIDVGRAKVMKSSSVIPALEDFLQADLGDLDVLKSVSVMARQAGQPFGDRKLAGSEFIAMGELLPWQGAGTGVAAPAWASARSRR